MRTKKLGGLVLAGLVSLSLVACGTSQHQATQNADEAKTTEEAVTKNDAGAEKGTENSTETKGKTEADVQTSAKAEDLKGSITMAGSTSMEKFANALAEAFMEKYPNVTVQAEFTGSSAGVEAVLSGQSDIGDSSRNLKDAEKEKGAVENIVAIDGIAVVVDAANTADNLTKEQLVDIYNGTISNWSEVGGSNQPVVVVGREAGSGTRGAFEEILKLEDACKYANELDSTGAVMAKVASTPGAIGYVSLDVLDDTIKPLSLDGVEATEENIKAGTYFLSRPFVMATKGEIEAQSDLVKALFSYVYSEEGAELVQSVGLIPAE